MLTQQDKEYIFANVLDTEIGRCPTGYICKYCLPDPIFGKICIYDFSFTEFQTDMFTNQTENLEAEYCLPVCQGPKIAAWKSKIADYKQKSLF